MSAGLHPLAQRSLAATLALTLILVVSWASAAPAKASADVSLHAVPATVVLKLGETQSVVLVLSNDSDKPVRLTGLQAHGAGSISTAVSGLSLPATLPAGGALQARLELTAGDDATETSIAVLLSSTSDKTDQVSTATIAVKPTALASPTVTLIGFPTQLDDSQDGSGNISIGNPTNQVFTNLVVTALDDEDLRVRPRSSQSAPPPACATVPGSSTPDCELARIDELRPGETKLVPVVVGTDESVRTGTQTASIVLEAVPARTADMSSISSVTVVSSMPIDLRVFGLDALTPFGIGSLFIFPGLLAALLFLALVRWVYPKTARFPDTIDLKDLRAFPFIAVGGILAYVVFWLLWGRDLTESVGTSDVAWLSVVSLGIGVMGWAVVALLWWWRTGRKIFAVGDTPRAVLKSLRAGQAPLTLPTFDLHGVTYAYLALIEGQKVIAAPIMTYVIANALPPERRSAISTAIGADDISAILRAQRSREVTLGWSIPSGVAAVDESEIKSTSTARLLQEVLAQ
jgi:hypothetical protein